MKEGDKIAVWVSCGAASAMALIETIRQYGEIAEIHALNTFMAEEDDDNQRFLSDLAEYTGKEIVSVKSDLYPSGSAEEVWTKRRYMSSPYGAPCTAFIKKRARQQWEEKNQPDWNVLGFTYDEIKRHEMFCLTERANTLPVLIDAKMTKACCSIELRQRGLRLPRMYHLGFPNANCPGCVKANGVTYWNTTRVVFPVVFDQRAKLSREIGCKLVRYKGKRIYLDELPADAKGNKMASMPECGIFCEEKIR